MSAGGLAAGVRRGLRRIADGLQRGLFDPPDDVDRVDRLGAPAPAAPVGAPDLRHPYASREALLDGRRVAFRLVRVRRRSIGFVIDVHGLTVRAAARVPLREIDAAVHAKRRWILARLAEQHERSARAAAARIVWRDGASVDYLGEKLTVVLDPARVLAGDRDGVVAIDIAHASSLFDPAAEPMRQRRLSVGLPRDAAPERIRDAVQSWLQREASRVFAERVAVYAERLGVQVRRLSLSSAATRWGSANASGAVRLHWRLIEHPLATIDYVVAHELAHLREMNHSPRFWRIVESVVPDYREVRRQLRSAEHLSM